MSSAKTKPTYYVCLYTDNSNTLLEEIEASSENEASEVFNKQHNIFPLKILGPYIKKKSKPIESSKEIHFSGEIKQAIYNNYKVNAFFLKDPIGYAFLVFIKSLSSDRNLPKGTTIVPIKDLRF